MTDELVDPDQEAHLLEDPNDFAAWRAYAAWLTERGEPRGELIRETVLGAGSEAARRVIAAQWSRWFGALPPASVACDWSGGFVRELRLKAEVPAELTGRALFSRHSLAFLRTLKLDVGARPSLLGIEALRLLRRIELTGSEHHLKELTLHRPAAIRELRVGSQIAGDAMEMLGRVPWLGEVPRLELGVLGSSDVRGLLAHPHALDGFAGTVALEVREEAVVAHRSELRAAFPKAWLLTVVNPRDHHYQRLNPTARSTPHRAPANFRELPPSVTRQEPAILSRDMESYTVGSGVRIEEGSPIYSRCAACASLDTLCIYSKSASSYSSRHCESYYWSMREFVCNECGQFTYYEAYRED